jgi:neogenin
MELERGAEYQVRLWALNANGTGPPTDWISVTTLDSDLDESQVPDPPLSLRGKTCNKKLSKFYNSLINSFLVN